jgi:hypothetical protein
MVWSMARKLSDYEPACHDWRANANRYHSWCNTPHRTALRLLSFQGNFEVLPYRVGPDPQRQKQRRVAVVLTGCDDVISMPLEFHTKDLATA